MKAIVCALAACLVVSGQARAEFPADESVLLACEAGYPHGLTSDGTHLLLTDYNATKLYRLDPANGAIVDSVAMNAGGRPRGAAWDGSNLWVAISKSVRKIDPFTGERLDSFTGLSTNQQGLAFDGTNLWLVCSVSGQIICVARDGTVVTNFPSPAASPRGIEFHAGRLWHVDSYNDRILEIDPATGGTVSSFLFSRGGARDLTWHGDRFWLVDRDRGQIIGLTLSQEGNHTRSMGYVSRGVQTCRVVNDTTDPFVDTHIYTALAASDRATELLSRRFFIDGVASRPSGLVTDEFAQVTADFDVGTVPAGQQVTLTVDHVARLHNWTVEVDPAHVGDLADIPPEIAALYTRDESMYQINDPYIQNQAALAVGDATNIHTKVRRIHDYLVTRITYSLDLDVDWSNAKTILQAADSQTSCSGYVFCMIALCRAVGIPARFAGGSECRSLDEGRIDELHHRWVEVYLPGYGWVPFDPTHDEGPAESDPVRGRERGAQHRALVLRRGGGPNTMGWVYNSYAAHAAGKAPTEKQVAWSGQPWDDSGDFDGDGVLNASDAFPYDLVASIDTDSDGMPDGWHPGYDADDSSSETPLVVDANDDNDRMSDEAETIAGTDPLDPTSMFVIRRADLATGDPRVVLTWPSVSGRVYTVWHSPEPGGTSHCDVAGIPAAPPLNSHTSACPVTSGFYRIGVAYPAGVGPM